MELLLELFQINEQVEQELFEGQLMTLLEDLGNLKQLNIGPMINAFKQHYSSNKSSRGRSLTQTDVGNKLNRNWVSRIGRDSEVIQDSSVIKNWNHVRRVIDKAEGNVSGAVINLNKKPIAVMVTPYAGELNYKDTAVGLAWDFTRGAVLKDEEKDALLKVLSAPEADYRKHIVKGSKDKSEATSVKWESFYKSDKIQALAAAGKPPRSGERNVPVKDYETWYDAMKDGGAKIEKGDEIVKAEFKGMPAGEWNKKEGKGFFIQRGEAFNPSVDLVYGKPKQIQGIAQRVENVKEFINLLAKYGTVTLTLILGDKIADVKASERRARGTPEPRILDATEMRNAKEALKKRLAIFKAGKLESVEDAAAFLKKVFEGKAKKINFAGQTYIALPEAKYLGSNHRAGGRDSQSFYDRTMQNLIAGKAIEISFDSDRSKGDSGSLYMSVKLVNGTLTPVSARYYENGKQKTETF
jgi:hypothetical protein